MNIKKPIKKLFFNSIRARDQIFGKQIIRFSKYKSPEFLIIGVTKGGTTSLFQYLIQHPNILAPQKKELAFFSWNSKIGLKQYLENFPIKEINVNSLTFEATPSYLFYKNAPIRVASFFPNIKLIVILRDPVTRAYSHWQFYHNSKFVKEKSSLRDKRSFRVAVKDELDNLKKIPWHSQYIYIGKYAKHLKKWYKYFPMNQIFLLDSAELKYHSKAALKKTTDFLEVQDHYQNFEKTKNKKEGLLESPDERTDKRLIEYNVNHYQKAMSNDIKKILYQYYAPYNKELFEISGKKFSWM